SSGRHVPSRGRAADRRSGGQAAGRHENQQFRSRSASRLRHHRQARGLTRERTTDPVSAAQGMSVAIHVSHIRKSYRTTLAVDDVSFDVETGEIFGLIGPNGAGKTTTLECAEGLRTPDAGEIAVLGLDPFRDARRLQERIGVQLQEAQLQKRIKVKEAVALWASLYPRPVDGVRLLEQLGLGDKRDAWFMTLSGGQKQRLF